MLGTLNPIDLGIIFIYFAIILWIAWWVSKGGGKNKGERDSKDYFLAGKTAGWFVIGASLFASNIGSEIIIGVSGAGARAEMPQANFEILAALILILLGWVFVPFYLRTGVYTMPEFLEIRYSKACRNYLSVVSVLAYIITKISLIIFAGALVFETMGVSFWTGAIITIVATGFYTILGGLRAVIYTDMIQTFILLAGTIAVTYFGLAQIGGWNSMMDTLIMASEKPGNPEASQFFNLWRPSSDTDYPWTGMLFGAPILGVWYWCTDQFIVQRTLSAKDISNARKGTLFAGFLKLLPVFIFFIPGVIAFALSQKGMLNFTLDNPDHALPAMINGFLPIGLKGLAISGLLAALMSSLSSAFNSSSTLITFDFYKQYKPHASEKELVWVGQIATLILVVMSFLWIPFMKTLMGGGLFHYLQSVQAYISPPIAAVFLFGLFFKWINARGAIMALWSGFILGMTRLVTEYLTKEGIIELTPGSLLQVMLDINFLHYAIYLFIFSVAVLMLFSQLGRPKSDDLLRLVTFNKSEMKLKFTWSADVWLTLLLISCVLALWIIFSPLVLA
ncbi:sodium:solute symporter [Lutimonas zeaxanthinifaciens]|uniref:sodium:solute symporter n=1 Tax=Lutimonas zeaxanthinifaciens TaxID=3060215 RepID=UPI00265CE0A0|nr:sodium:solute symporter [Lutimonas sp. YSD2104]WKK66329.1 sodium:solute symporter [Lutimonas sp. YSD2104]